MKNLNNSISNPANWLYYLKRCSIILALVFINIQLYAHTVQGAWCFSPSGGDLRIYLEHWHHAFSSPPPGSTIQVTITASGVTTTRTLPATGVINHTPIGNLPHHPSSSITVIGECDGSANNHNNWAYWDTPIPLSLCPAGGMVTISVCCASNVDFEECGDIFPLSLTSMVICPEPPFVNNNAAIEDPCACNLTGDGLADGTFNETVTVTGNTTGETWTVTSIAPLNPGGVAPTGIAVSNTLTDIGGDLYEISFDHSNMDGYNLTVERSSDNRQLTISNVCSVPNIAFNPAIPSMFLNTDSPITLGAAIMDNSHPAAGFPTFSLDGINNITQLIPHETTTDMAIGQVASGSFTITGHYETDGTGTGSGGTMANPAVPTNACPVEMTEAFMGPAPVPTLGQWGLIILALLLVNFAFVMLTAPKLATTTGQQFSTFNLKNLPFDGNAYGKIWAATAVSILAIFIVAIQLFGYELTSADPFGAFMSSFLVAYAVFTLKNEK